MRHCAIWTAAVILAVALAGQSRGAADLEAYARNACVQCHGDIPGRLSEMVDVEWKGSVHYQAGVACDGCHGGEPGVQRQQFDSMEAWKNAAHLKRDPEFTRMRNQAKDELSVARGRSISYFCGKCHATVKERHLGSPHGAFGAPTCLYCHGQGSHAITPATPAILDTRGRAENGRCSPCHQAASMEVVDRVQKALIETEKQILLAGEQYDQLEEWGYHNLELEGMHHHGAEVVSGLRRIFHTLDMRQINNFSGEVQELAGRIQAAHDLIGRVRRTQRLEALIGLGAIILLVSFALLLVYYKHQFLHDNTVPEPSPDPEDEDEHAQFPAGHV